MCKKKTYAFTMFYDRLEKPILILKWRWSEKKKPLCENWEHLTEQVTEKVPCWLTIQKRHKWAIPPLSLLPCLGESDRAYTPSVCDWSTFVPAVGVHSELQRSSPINTRSDDKNRIYQGPVFVEI